MVDSITDLCNLALTYIGSSRITSLADGSEQASSLNAIYQQALDKVINEHDWTPAIHRVALSTDAGDNLYDFDYKYTLPTSPKCLKVIRIVDEDYADSASQWIVRGRFLYTDLENAVLEYVKEMSDSDIPNMHTELQEACAWQMAEMVAMDLTQSVRIRTMCTEEYAKALAKAVWRDTDEKDEDTEGDGEARWEDQG